MPSTEGNLTSEYYSRHHAGLPTGSRYGFTFGGKDRVDWICSRVGTGIDILDIGCRDGTLTSLYSAGNRVHGIDVDPTAAEMARITHGIEAQVTNLNVSPIPFVEESFDAVVASEVLEHLQFPDAVVSEVRRVLRPHGVFLGSVPNSFRVKNRLLFLLGREFEADPTHLHQFSPRGLRRLLRGFQQIEIDFRCSRFLRLSPRLMANTMMFCCRR